LLCAHLTCVCVDSLPCCAAAVPAADAVAQEAASPRGRRLARSAARLCACAHGYVRIDAMTPSFCPAAPSCMPGLPAPPVKSRLHDGRFEWCWCVCTHACIHTGTRIQAHVEQVCMCTHAHMHAHTGMHAYRSKCGEFYIF